MNELGVSSVITTNTGTTSFRHSDFGLLSSLGISSFVIPFGYFVIRHSNAGCKLVWITDPETRTVTVYTAVDQSEEITEDGTLDGDDVLPGFSLSVREWFERAGEKELGN